ncbi:MAG: FtsX-like permease family protein [Candidatus Hodarchaeales archaeon]
MRNLGTEISIDYIFSEKIIYLSFSFFKNNTGYFRLYGFYNENVSYLIDQPSSLGQDSSTTLFDVLFVQMSSQSSVSIGENISLSEEEIEGEKIEIHVKDVININTIRDNDILNFYSSDAADLIFICRFDTLLTLVSILLSLESFDFDTLSLQMIQFLDYDKSWIKSTSELSDIVTKILRYISSLKNAYDGFEGVIYSNFLGDSYLSLFHQLILLLMLPIILLSIYFVFYQDQAFSNDFFRLLKSLRMKGFGIRDTLIFILISNLILVIFSCLCGSCAGILFLFLFGSRGIKTEYFISYLIQSPLNILIVVLVVFMSIFSLVFFSDVNRYKQIVDNEYIDYSARTKGTGFLARNFIDVFLWFSGIVIFFLIQGLQPRAILSNDSRLLMILNFVLIMQTLSFYLILIGTILIITRFYYYYVTILGKIVSSLKLKRVILAVKYSSRSIHSSRLALIIITVSLFLVLFSSSTSSIILFNLQERTNYCTGSDISIIDYQFINSAILDNFAQQNNITSTRIIKLTSTLSGSFLGIDPSSYHAAAYKGDSRWYSVDICNIDSILSSNHSVLLNNYAKKELKVNIGYNIGIPEIFKKSNETDGVFQVKGFFELWPNFVEDDEFSGVFYQSDRHSVTDNYFYVMNSDLLTDYIDKGWLVGDVEYLHYFKVNGKEQEQNIRSFLDDNLFSYNTANLDDELLKLPWSLLIELFYFFNINAWMILIIIVVFFCLFQLQQRNIQISIHRLIGVNLKHISRLFTIEVVIHYLGTCIIAIIILFPLLISFGIVFPIYSSIPPPVFFPPIGLIVLITGVYLILCFIITWIVSRQTSKIRITTLLKVE